MILSALRAAMLCVIAGSLPLSEARAANCPAADPALIGHYDLRGELEMAAWLMLRPDGQFEFALAYGATDQYGRGCWQVRGDLLALHVHGESHLPSGHSPADPVFRGMVLHIAPDGTLRWPLPAFRGVFHRNAR